MAGVRFDGVAKVYPDGTRAVNGFDLEISDGEFMVLVGPSGCGKTTALGCTITGGREGIVTHSSQVDLENNLVTATSLRGIAMTEMSMGMIGHNQVAGAKGIGIFCGDRSECMIERNHVSGTRADNASNDLGQRGYGIESNFEAVAELSHNELYGNDRGVGAIAGGKLSRR